MVERDAMREIFVPGRARRAGRRAYVTTSSMLRLLSLAVLAAALLSCDALRAMRGCGVVPLDSSVIAPVQPPSVAPVGAGERERRAREAMAGRFGLPIEEVLIREQTTQSIRAGVYSFKLYGVDGRYLGPIFVDASGAPVSEAALMLTRTIADVRDGGKVDTQLSDVVARTRPADVVPVMFQLVAPPWDGPPTPWPLDLSPDAWNSFVERYADAFYRPRVAPFIEYLRSIGASDIAPDLATGEYVKDAWYSREFRRTASAARPAGALCCARSTTRPPRSTSTRPRRSREAPQTVESAVATSRVRTAQAADGGEVRTTLVVPVASCIGAGGPARRLRRLELRLRTSLAPIPLGRTGLVTVRAQP